MCVGREYIKLECSKIARINQQADTKKRKRNKNEHTHTDWSQIECIDFFLLVIPGNTNYTCTSIMLTSFFFAAAVAKPTDQTNRTIRTLSIYTRLSKKVSFFFAL